MQDNGQVVRAYNDLLTTLQGLNEIAVVSETVLSPEQVAEFPTACIILTDGSREAADVQLVHFRVTVVFFIYLHVHATETKAPIGNETGMTPMLLELIEKVIDAVDAMNQDGGLARAHGYSVWASNPGATDAGTLAMGGTPQAFAIVNVTAQLPVADKVVV